MRRGGFVWFTSLFDAAPMPKQSFRSATMRHARRTLREGDRSPNRRQMRSARRICHDTPPMAKSQVIATEAVALLIADKSCGFRKQRVSES